MRCQAILKNGLECQCRCYDCYFVHNYAVEYRCGTHNKTKFFIDEKPHKFNYATHQEWLKYQEHLKNNGDAVAV